MIDLTLTLAGRVGPMVTSLPGLDPAEEVELVVTVADRETATTIARRLEAAGAIHVEVVAQGVDE